ncbi:cadherin-like protein 26 [Bombina bombina]|uniref:cadherin-like protein 26 n=1 Tax=Bombina bombina TaxID=8345 RepID=UPI00235A57F6|nr:cadherin-like protein 26 [Bombina bombina]
MRGLYLLVFIVLVVIASCNSYKSQRARQKKSIARRSLNQAESLRPLRRTKRRWVLSTIVLEENDVGPFPKIAGELFNDQAANMSIKYLISGPGVDEFPEVGLFTIDDLNGVVYVHRSIDREKTPLFVVRFDVAERVSGKIVDRSLIFNVEIKDKNDNAPEFTQKEYNIPLKETFNLENPVFQVIALDKDLEDTPNSEVTYSVVSQIPSLPDVSFTVDSKSGLIRGNGCLKYEAANLIRLLIRAQDKGPDPMSSTATVVIKVEDGNNNMPEIAKGDYDLKIPEGELKNNILRIKVEDKDLTKTPAWRAKFKILSGNERGYYNISTDPDTNEGILDIIKPLDFEGTPKKQIVISVENEEPLSSCQNGKVKVEKSSNQNNLTINVSVLDTNDAPIFTPIRPVIREKEGLKAGSVLLKVNATDPDLVPNKIRYKIASDPAGWVTIDENTGVITTVQELDRESPYVNQTLYPIVVHAIDNGDPPQTGSGTVLLYVSDVNDNTPRLASPYLERCDQVKDMTFPINAEDKDLDPFSGPFKFEISDDSKMVQDSWRISRSTGNSGELTLLKSLPKGNYSVPLKIYDRQGYSGSQTLNVRVCSCPDGKTCEKLQPAAQFLGGGAIGVMFAALFLFLLGLCLLMCFVCGSASIKNNGLLPNDEGNQTLIKYNEEGGSALNQASPALLSPVSAGNGNTQFINKDIGKPSPSVISQRAQLESWERNGAGMSPSGAKQQVQSESWMRGVQANQGHNGTWKQGSLQSQANKNVFITNSKYSRNGSLKNKSPDVFVDKVGEMVKNRLREICGEDDAPLYKPRVYAYEGELERINSVGELSVPESESDLGFLDDLDPKFGRLMEICYN